VTVEVTFKRHLQGFPWTVADLHGSTGRHLATEDRATTKWLSARPFPPYYTGRKGRTDTYTRLTAVFAGQENRHIACRSLLAESGVLYSDTFLYGFGIPLSSMVHQIGRLVLIHTSSLASQFEVEMSPSKLDSWSAVAQVSIRWGRYQMNLAN
jgi:hypothetical protein